MPFTTQPGLSPGPNGRGGRLKPLLNREQSRSLHALVVSTDAALWVEAVGRALDAGAALLLSPTSDGGAFSITVLDGDDRSRSYAGSTEEVDELLRAVRAHFDTSEPPASQIGRRVRNTR